MAGCIKNSKVIAELTKDGSKIENWAKFKAKDPITRPEDRYYLHFYKNKITNEVNYMYDYKAKMD